MTKLRTLNTAVRMAPSLAPKTAAPEAQRLRGRPAVVRRREYLRLHPLCTACRRADRIEAATVPDHVVPLWAGGPDDLDSNGQALCEACHAAKTGCEAAMRAAGAWLATPCRCGLHLAELVSPADPGA